MARIEGGELSPIDNFTRTSEFWVRTAGIYFGYKATQMRALAVKTLGWSQDQINTDIWNKQHEHAADQMYSLCVDLRGFYLKSGQFLGARGDFVPEQICRKLSLLHDQVPPMPSHQVRKVIEEELGGIQLENVFEWIDLENPLGSASISQVHKAKLAPLKNTATANTIFKKRRRWSPLRIFFGNGTTTTKNIPCSTTHINDTTTHTLDTTASSSLLSPPPHPPLDMETIWKEAPSDGIVAVKVQYPNALPTMSLDLSNLRLLAAFLSKTELKFDMLSAVDELSKQIRLEFDFKREARIMDAVARQFEKLGHKIRVPRSVPSMVTSKLLVMDFLDGVPITRMKDNPKFQNLSQATKQLAAHRILSRVSEAYGRMLLLDGLFQADGHPGNLLVMKGGVVGIIDYGQSKRLPDVYRASFAKLILALEKKGNDAAVAEALDALGVVTGRNDIPLKAEMARGMFDTSGKVDPFDPESPIKKMEISTFPADMFFVLRVVQLLRGLADGMGVTDFSSAKQWKEFAEDAQKQLKDVGSIEDRVVTEKKKEGQRNSGVTACLSSHIYSLFV